MRPFGFWCQKVLPLVYDDSLSYYEVLCKVRDKLNEVISSYNDTDARFAQLQAEIDTINQWISNFDTGYIKKLVDGYVATMIFVEISGAGYVVYNMPETWNDIQFNTTELDIEVKSQPEYGHLVLSY